MKFCEYEVGYRFWFRVLDVGGVVATLLGNYLGVHQICWVISVIVVVQCTNERVL